MSALGDAVDDYIMVRRTLGSKLDSEARLLASFVAYVEAVGAKTVTTELAVAWAKLPGPDAHPSYLGRRLCAVRGFARHLQAFDPATEVPSAQLLPMQSCRAVPYLYSEDEILALMEAASRLTPALRAATYETLIGLLWATGMRIGEVVRLNQADVDWEEGILTVWHSKFDKSRELPLHPSTLQALTEYASVRDELCPRAKEASFFMSTARRRMVLVTVQSTFTRLVRQVGLKPRSERCRPRVHDLRHTFACRVLLGWYQAGVDVEAHLPQLSTYLGHVDPSSTFWYLTATPELMALAAQRRDRARSFGS